MQSISLSEVLQRFEYSEFAEKQALTKDEYILLHRLSEGYEIYDITFMIDYSRAKIFRLQQSAIKKLSALNKIHAVSLYIQSEMNKEKRCNDLPTRMDYLNYKICT